MKTLLPAVLTVLSFVLGGAVMFGLVQARVVASPVDPTGLPEHSHGEAADGDIGVSLGEYLKLPKMPKILPRQTSRIIYLNREGVRLRPGTDNAAHNESSIVRGSGLEVADVPAFSGSQRSWRRIVKCLESKFKPFGVVVTDQRPVHSDNYIMATFGGTARLLGRTRKSSSHTGGLAPFNSRSIPGAVVFIFSST
ncbi:MAG: hypothetical protein KC502_08300, partial [Myxococcales bacterium]|nr:hypothetical protein [Myxococcales bacterium]